MPGMMVDLKLVERLLGCKQYFQKYVIVKRAVCDKAKSSEVPFYRITSSYSYFEQFEFLRQFSKKQDMIKKKHQLNRNEKFVDKAQQCFAFLHIKAKFKFAAQ